MARESESASVNSIRKQGDYRIGWREIGKEFGRETVASLGLSLETKEKIFKEIMNSRLVSEDNMSHLLSPRSIPPQMKFTSLLLTI